MIPEPGFQNPMLYCRSESGTVTCQHVPNSYLRGGSAQKVVNLPVDVDGALKIGDTTNLSLNQVITVDGGGNGSPIHSSRHELQDSHLDECIRTNEE